MTQMMLILALAVTVEGLVQYAKCIIDMIVKKEYKTTITQLAALVVSIVLCLLAGADIYATFGITFIGGWVGMVLTGVLASRGGQLRGGCHQTPAECSARQSRSRKYKIKTNKSSPGMPGEDLLVIKETLPANYVFVCWV